MTLLHQRLVASKLQSDQKGRRLENPRKNKLLCRTIDRTHRHATYKAIVENFK